MVKTHHDPAPDRRQETREMWPRGFTLLELLVVLGITGVLVGVSLPPLLKPRPDVLAAAVQSAMQRARLTAVQRQRPVAFAFDTVTGEFITRVKAGPARTGCGPVAGDRDLPRVSLADTPRVEAATTMPADALTPRLSGVLWQTSGLPAACDGRAFPGGAYTFRPSGSSAGAVRLQLNTAGLVVLR
jgi:prepilin-type N-terminal cleavage/methylation domain-containing protein